MLAVLTTGVSQNTLDPMLKTKLALFRLIVIFLNNHYLRVQQCEGYIKEWIGIISKRVSTRGAVETIAYVKNIRLCFTRHMCGAPLKESPGSGVQLDKEGLPIGVPFVKLFQSHDPYQLRLGFTLLSISRYLSGWKSPDLSTISDPCKGTKVASYATSLAAITRRLGWTIPVPRWEQCHVTTKSGPNAQALLSSIEDAHLLSESQISDLRLVGGEELVRLIETSRLVSVPTWLSMFGLSPKGRLAKLSLVKDKEAKCRIVAILDYWTQSGLKPLHDSLMGFLRSLRSDCTYNQGGFRRCLPLVGPYHSLDLTAATDRVPVEIQEAVLEAMLGSKEYAAAWRRLICDRDFSYSWAGGSKTIRYSTGQPMGAYSSWAMFAVTHHAIVRLAALRAGYSPFFWLYALLGDDIVIANDRVAQEYRTILQEIGVDVSELKTHVSQDTYEFAKRWIFRGTEVSAAPLGSLFEAVKFARSKDLDESLGGLNTTKTIKKVGYYDLATWLREVEARWQPRSNSLVSRGLFASLFHLLGRGPASSRLASKA